MADKKKSPFVIPESLTDITDLAAAEAEALEAADAIASLDDPTDEQLNELDAIVEHVEAVRVEGQRRESEVQERRDRAQAARDRLAAPADSETPAEEETPDEGDETPEGDETADEGTETPEAVVVEVETPEAVAASAKRAPSLIRRQRQPENPRPAEQSSGVTITASAGIRDVEPGSKLNDLDAVVEAFMSRARSHPSAFAPDIYNRHSVATFSRNDFGGLDTGNKAYRDDHQALLDAAADETRLTDAKGQKGLAAAGGWCAPSETLYDIVSLESADGLYDMPEVGVKRGGIKNTTGPDFSDIYAGVGFAQTEAEAIAGTTKNCYEVDCPDFQETRLDAVGLCVKSGLLTASGYPELVRRVLAGAFVAHQHKMSIRALNSVATQLGTAVVVPDSGSVARSTLTTLELAAEGQRNLYRMPRNMTMEVVLPNWARVALRADLQDRLRSVEPVTDAQLDAHFAARKLRVQFVYGFGDTRIITVPGGGTLLTDFPDTMPALMYPAGTFVKGVADVISLDTVYDSTDLQVNVYTAAFFEEGMLVARRAPGGGRLTIPVNVSGRVGPADLPKFGVTDA